MPPYEFTRREDGPGNITFAAHINELQIAIETLGPRLLHAARIPAGGYITEPGLVYSGGTGFSANTMYFLPLFLGPESVALQSLVTRVSTAGSGGSTARLGLYTHDPNAYAPADLIDDIGTIATDSNGIKTVAYAETVEAEHPDWVIWLACAVQVSTSFIAPSSSTAGIHPLGAAMTSDGEPHHGYSQTHTYGALPASAGTLTAIGRPIMIVCRKA